MSYRDGKIKYISFNYNIVDKLRGLNDSEFRLLIEMLILTEDENEYRFEGYTQQKIDRAKKLEQIKVAQWEKAINENPQLETYFEWYQEKREVAIAGYRDNIKRYNNRKNTSLPVNTGTGEVVSPISSPIPSLKTKEEDKVQVDAPVQPEIKEVAPSVSKEETPIAKMEETTPVVVEKKEPSPMDKLMQMEEKEKNVSQPADGDLFDDFEGMMEGWEG